MSAAFAYTNAGWIGTWLALLVSCAHANAADPPVAGIRAVAFSPDGKLCAASTGQPEQKGTVTLWEIASRKALWTHDEKLGIPAVSFAPNGKTLAIAVLDHNARLLDVVTGKPKLTLPHPKEVRAVDFSPDGKLLATACWDGAVRVWDLAAETETVICDGHKDRIFAASFSPDGKLLVSGGGKDGVKVWDASTGVQKHAWIPQEVYTRSAVFVPGGRWVLSGGWDGKIRLWSVETGEMLARFSPNNTVEGVAVSPVTRAFAVCGAAHHVQIIPLNLGEPSEKDRKSIQALLAKLDDDAIEIREDACKELMKLGYVAEPELRRASKESESAEVRMRARRTRKEILDQQGMLLKGHTDAVDCVSFAPDGKVLASGSKDGTVRLWDVASGKEMAVLRPK
jgi:WD40 repeat protein